MQQKKDNAPDTCKQQECIELLDQIMEIMRTKKARESDRQKLTKMYIQWMRNEGKDLIDKEEVPYFNVFGRLDRLLELTEKITPREFNGFLCNSTFIQSKKS